MGIAYLWVAGEAALGKFGHFTKVVFAPVRILAIVVERDLDWKSSTQAAKLLYLSSNSTLWLPIMSSRPLITDDAEPFENPPSLEAVVIVNVASNIRYEFCPLIILYLPLGSAK
jgi:hypothetical protein